MSVKSDTHQGLLVTAGIHGILPFLPVKCAMHMYVVRLRIYSYYIFELYESVDKEKKVPVCLDRIMMMLYD